MLMSKLVSMKYAGDSHIRQHILEMKNILTQLNDMKFVISDSFLVHLILTSLPTEYEPFKISYNKHNDEWSLMTSWPSVLKKMRDWRWEGAKCTYGLS